MLVWGALSAAMACVHNYPSILAFRFVLGCIESGFFPGVLFVMSCWYTTAEIGMFVNSTLDETNNARQTICNVL